MTHPAALIAVLVLAACSGIDGGSEPEGAARGGAAESAAAPATSPPVISGRFAPRDECTGLPGWKPFAAALRSAIAARDSDAFAALADPEIKLDFGGGGGKAELVRRFGDRSGHDLWSELDRIIALGCAKGVEPETATMPWFFEQDLGGEDPFEVWLVVGGDVPLLSAASTRAKPLARLGWVLVGPVGDSDWNAPIREVRLTGRNERGFVESNNLRSQIDYRLIARRQGDAWTITALLAGD